jgi:hypothetical protein
MFAMKRVILAAVFIVAISGFAAAQSTSAKQATKPGKATVKKGVPAKVNTTHTVLRHDDSATAKSDSTIKLILPVPKISDTTALPPVKKDEEL